MSKTSAILLVIYSVILLGIGACGDPTSNLATKVIATPVLSGELIIGDHDQKKLIELVQTFAKSNDFAVHIRQVQPDERYILIDLVRADLTISALNSYLPGEFQIFFYINKDQQVPQDVIDATAAKLKDLVPDIKYQAVQSY